MDMKTKLESLRPVDRTRLIMPLPCPFCGCKPKLVIQWDRWSRKFYLVRCDAVRCMANPRTHTHSRAGIPLYKQDAVDAWNSRMNAEIHP